MENITNNKTEDIHLEEYHRILKYESEKTRPLKNDIGIQQQGRNYTEEYQEA